ncbi:MAG: dephospho-CoA kinase [Chloroflexi bacterium]|nr:dephospho-CoA kinase [Chloroflexota bacterium]
MSNASTIIGLTGNIGTGKSAILEMMRAKGARTIDADKVAHQVMVQGGRAYDAIVQAFGSDILDSSGAIDRPTLGRIVFDDHDKLSLLEQIMHPAIYEQIGIEAEEAEEAIIVIEAIKLLEAGMSSALCDQVWVVTTPLEQQIERLMTTRNMSRQAAEARMHSQSPQSFKVSQADVVIDNSGSLEALQAQIDQACQRLGLATQV